MPYETSLRPYFVRMTCGHVEVRLMREATAGKPWTPTVAVDANVKCKACPGEHRNVRRPGTEPLHERDTMCALDVSDPGVCPHCIVCGVTFGDPCKSCRGRGFHFPGCTDPSLGAKCIHCGLPASTHAPGVLQDHEERTRKERT